MLFNQLVSHCKLIVLQFCFMWNISEANLALYLDFDWCNTEILDIYSHVWSGVFGGDAAFPSQCFDQFWRFEPTVQIGTAKFATSAYTSLGNVLGVSAYGNFNSKSEKEVVFFQVPLSRNRLSERPALTGPLLLKIFWCNAEKEARKGE